MLHDPIIPAPPMKRVTVLQGEVHVNDGVRVELSTVLGSCVATCLFDPFAEIGGMNHFLLAEPPNSHVPGEIDEHYGLYLMELLINEMLSKGAAKSRLRAHLYGGANIRPGMPPIGMANANFAKTFIEKEGIPLIRTDLGGTCARRVDFHPARGRMRCRVISNTLVRDAVPVLRPAESSGDVDLF